MLKTSKHIRRVTSDAVLNNMPTEIMVSNKQHNKIMHDTTECEDTY